LTWHLQWYLKSRMSSIRRYQASNGDTGGILRSGNESWLNTRAPAAAAIWCELTVTYARIAPLERALIQGKHFERQQDRLHWRRKHGQQPDPRAHCQGRTRRQCEGL